MLRFSSTVVSNAAVTNSVAASQTPSGAGNLTLTSSTVTFGSSAAQKITLTSTANIASRTFVVTGTDVYDNALIESISGPNNNTVTTTNCFKSVTNISISGAAGGALTAGNSADAEGKMYVADSDANPFSIGLGCVISGSPTFTVQHTFDNTIATGFVYGTSTWFNHSVIASKTTNQDGNYNFPVQAIKLTLAAAGTVTMTILQSGGGWR